jgi:hypothetical protein
MYIVREFAFGKKVSGLDSQWKKVDEAVKAITNADTEKTVLSIGLTRDSRENNVLNNNIGLYLMLPAGKKVTDLSKTLRTVITQMDEASYLKKSDRLSIDFEWDDDPGLENRGLLPLWTRKENSLQIEEDAAKEER